MTGKLEDFVKLPYSVRVVPDQTTEGKLCYLASYPDLPGCMSHGESQEEAINNLREAKKLYMKTLIERDREIPLPTPCLEIIWEASWAEPILSTGESPLFPGEIAPMRSEEAIHQ